MTAAEISVLLITLFSSYFVGYRFGVAAKFIKELGTSA